MTNVVVIGAGPYGLSTAAHLRRSQVPFRIFGTPMQMWRSQMPKGMVLKSDGFASNLSAPENEFPLSSYYAEQGLQYAPVGMRTPLETLVNYALEFQRRYVGGVEESKVVSVRKNGREFEIDLDTGERCSADRVVVASGLMPFRNFPDSLAQLPEEAATHVSAHHDLSRFDGKRVIVIGGGQSSMETSALLREAGAEVNIVTRRPVFWFDPAEEIVKPSLWRRIRRPNFGLGPGWRTWFLSEAPYAYRYLPVSKRLGKAYSSFGPAGSGWLKHRVFGLIPIHVASIDSVQMRHGEVQLKLRSDDGIRTLAADHVIAATGYKPDIRRIEFLQSLVPSVKTFRGTANGVALPVLDRSYQSSVPGLHFVGAVSAPTFGPSMRFIYGTRFMAERMVPALIPSKRTALPSKLSRQPA